eukprot:865477_1
MSSKAHPGGGYRKGAGAQEEDMCRRSTLFCNLEDPYNFRKQKKKKNNKLPTDKHTEWPKHKPTNCPTPEPTQWPTPQPTKWHTPEPTESP